jgi:hypothetical protein
MTVPPREETATLVLPTEDDPPAEVIAAWILQALSELPASARLRATVVAHELLTAARHRRSAPYVLRLTTRDRRTLAVTVDDCDPEPDDGSNLVVVAGLADQWGVERRRRARSTWAELAVDSPAGRLSRPDQPSPRATRGGGRHAVTGPSDVD